LDSRRVRTTVCYVRDDRDDVFDIDRRAVAHGVDYVEIRERHSADPSVWRALRAVIRERAIQIVHSHDYKTNVLALLAARAERIAALSTVHGWTGHSWRERFIYYPVDKRVLARFPRAIAVSSDIARELRRTGASPARLRTIVNGIDHRTHRRDRRREASARATLGIGSHETIIGAIGRAEPQKRFDLLLEALAIARRTRPSLGLVLAGDGSSLPSLRRLVGALQLDGACRLLGHRSDIKELHHAFDMLVQSSDYEGSANAVLEAMAMETPIVATAAGGTSELVEDGVHALLVAPGDPQAIADAIERTLADPDAAGQRVAAARRRVEHELSFDARMTAVERIYEELIAWAE
jgi:glycosyltransferase involved in cell wall biosynthesis